MLKSIDTKLSAVLVVAVFAVMMTFGPTSSNFQSAFAHYGVDINQCKDDEDYYDDHEDACDKNLQAHYGEDYNGNFGSKNINGHNNNDDDDDNDDDGNGNNSNQGIGQSQSSRQNSQCVAGGSLGNSCNNLSFQNQENSGNNAAGQQGGGDDDDNDDDGNGNNSNQGIGQDQDNEQNAQCVSGEDAIVSCDNVSFQNQVNSGNNALAQD
jgi:hypothetical protein